MVVSDAVSASAAQDRTLAMAECRDVAMRLAGDLNDARHTRADPTYGYDAVLNV